MKKSTLFFIFVGICVVFVFGIMPLVDNYFADNPEKAQAYVDSNPEFINATNALMASQEISWWLPGILLFGGAIALLFGASWLLKKIF